MTSSERIAAALAVALTAFASMALVGTVGSGRAVAQRRMDAGDCEDGDCPTGATRTEGPDGYGVLEGDESDSESEGSSLDNAPGDSESDSGSEGAT